MSDEVIIALISGAVTCVASSTAAIVSLFSHGKITKVEHATNSMKDALIAGALVEGKAAGIKEQQATETKERALRAEGEKKEKDKEATRGL